MILCVVLCSVYTYSTSNAFPAHLRYAGQQTCAFHNRPYTRMYTKNRQHCCKAPFRSQMPWCKVQCSEARKAVPFRAPCSQVQWCEGRKPGCQPQPSPSLCRCLKGHLTPLILLNCFCRRGSKRAKGAIGAIGDDAACGGTTAAASRAGTNYCMAVWGDTVVLVRTTHGSIAVQQGCRWQCTPTVVAAVCGG